MEVDLMVLKDIARKAGDAIMAIYSDPLEIEYKTDQSPLTAADKASHAVIVEGLQTYRSDIPILSEEGVAIPYSERKDWQLFWLVDPLDGTKEFIKKNGEFTVNIALIEQGRPTVGVVYAPALNNALFRDKGEGGLGSIRDRGAGSNARMWARF